MPRSAHKMQGNVQHERKNRNEEKCSYSDFVIGNKWIYRGAQEAPSLSPGEQPYLSHGDGHIWVGRVGPELSRLPSSGWTQAQPSGPPSPAPHGYHLPQPGLTERGKVPRFQGFIASEGPMRTLLSRSPSFPTLAPEFSTHRTIIP